MLADGLRELFATQGHALDQLTAAEPALVATELTTFDLVVVDIGLPGMDGLELVRRIRARRNKVPILILTARDARLGGEPLALTGRECNVLEPLLLVVAASGLFDYFGALSMTRQALDGQLLRTAVALAPLAAVGGRGRSDRPPGSA